MEVGGGGKRASAAAASSATCSLGAAESPHHGKHPLSRFITPLALEHEGPGLGTL